MDFKKKVILISGATGGISEEIAKLLSKEECRLALFARREEKLVEISKKLIENKAQCIYLKCDIKNFTNNRIIAFQPYFCNKLSLCIFFAQP